MVHAVIDLRMSSQFIEPLFVLVQLLFILFPGAGFKMGVSQRLDNGNAMVVHGNTHMTMAI
jgi:hypothetical protein